MSDGMWLDDEEIAELTDRERRPAQSRVLTFMGVEHKRRPDGSIVVLRAHVEKIFGEGVVSKKVRAPELNFDAIR